MVYGAGIRETSRDALSQLRVTQEALPQTSLRSTSRLMVIGTKPLFGPFCFRTEASDC